MHCLVRITMLFLLIGCSRTVTAPQTFTVATTYLPTKIDPRRNMINVFHYINLQLYYPMMSRDLRTPDLSSQFLDMRMTRALSPELNEFRFCLRDDVHFSDGSPVTLQDLSDSIREIHAERSTMPPLVSLRAHDRCVDVGLGESDPDYFEKYTVVSSTILKTSSLTDKVPLGLGAYRVTEWDSGVLELSLIQTDHDVQFSKIQFIKVTDATDARTKDLIDLNLLYWEPYRSHKLGYLADIQHPIMRNYLGRVAL